MKIKIKDVKEKLHADAYSVKKGVFTVRRSFYYKMGKSTETFRADILEKIPNAVIVDSGEKYVAFRGGGSVAQGSHWWVKFTVPE